MPSAGSRSENRASSMADLFAAEEAAVPDRPLADRMRPATLDEFSGQGHLLEPGKPLLQALQQGRAHSMVFWGPPGTGKTTLSRLIAATTDSHFIGLSAVMAGVKDIRAAVDEAKQYRQMSNRSTVLAIGRYDRVFFAKSRFHPGSDGFLSNIYMAKAPDLLLAVHDERTLFKAADAKHELIPIEVLLL